MSWAARRRFIILLILGSVAVAFVATIGIATFYETPTCTDTKQNQDETGVDCGGSCPYLCTADEIAPTVLFTKVLRTGDGRTDVIAEIENKNAEAAVRGASYRIALYGADQSFVQEATGTLDLPPAAIVPVFVSGISSGKQTVTRAFLDLDPASLRWSPLPADPRILPSVAPPTLGGATSTPRVDAVLTNPSVTQLTDVRVVALVHSEKGDVIAASATLVSLPPLGSTAATFTWNEPFAGIPALIEVIPVVPLL